MASTIQAQVDVLNQDEDSSQTPSEEYSPEQISEFFSTIVSQVDRTERFTRDRMLRLWKYLELLWSGAGNYYWDHTVGQWRAITQEDIALISNTADVDPTLINKVVNVIRPYGESLVGVLTTGLPRVKYFPEDADNELDIQASKAYSNIEKKIVEDNMMSIRLMEILVKMWNGGFAAAYNYSHTDKKYGVTKEPIYTEKDFIQNSLVCTVCGNETLGEENTEIDDAVSDTSFGTDVSQDEMLDQEDVVVPDIPQDPMMGQGAEEIDPTQGLGLDVPETIMNDCPECGGPTPHLSTDIQGNKPFETGEVEVPKSRQIINIYGPMNVKIPSLAVRKEHVIWLILEEEIDIALARHIYPEHRDKISSHSTYDIDIDRLARVTYEISADTLKEAVTIRKVWLTPASFEKLDDVKQAEFLKQKYPTGVMAIFCANVFLEAEEQDLNDHWTISINPLYTRIMADPLGKALIGLHETTNDIFQLELDNFRFSIPQTFADPAFFDFKSYANTRAMPGTITPMKKPPGGRLEDAFAETKASTIPKETENLDNKVERLLQFISGVLPAVFGGPASGSKTLGEYEQSKNQALQRLSIIWKIVSIMYAELMAKAVKMYKKDLREDEHFVTEQGQGNYLNVWIRREELQGSVGEVRPELSEQFPMTWGQISARVMELLTMNNQVITSWFLHPENVELIYSVLGISDLYVPGEDQRNKQLYEISEMLATTPLPTGSVDPQTGQEVMQTSVQIEEIDDDAIHMEVIKAFLNSTVGMDLKNTNPNAYMNIMLHYQMHQMRMMEIQAQQQEQRAQQDPNTQTSDQVQ